MPQRIVLHIHGRVQGVAFRAHARQRAAELGLSGLVRNRLDGSVELVAEGSPEAIQAILDWAHHGPPSARVDHVEARRAECTGDTHGFVIAPTR